ncbi:MAG: hypothetical protein H6548_09000 [Chitinophagales bacterium]|nr:hypothetical protein [Chitinophagales bacterium]
MRIDLKQYSLLANSIIGAGSVLQAQVNYIDIEPDIEIDTFTVNFLDINGTMTSCDGSIIYGLVFVENLVSILDKIQTLMPYLFCI